MEYASQLYKNPRGIGCQHCHGQNGEGKLIANYVHKNEKKSFSGPAINKMDFAAFHKALNDRKRGMPRYFLTKKEVQALYLYLQENNKKESSNAK
ncbi:MAG: cytochrome c [Campylobacterota bacterium]|nr:cytochrome c [Campylobacterota bacterium]